MQSRKQFSIHSNWHQQVIYVRLNQESNYSHPKEQRIWNYVTAEIDNLRRVTIVFSWKKYVYNDVDGKRHIFNETINNILFNQIPNEKDVSNDGYRYCINKDIKQPTL